MITIEELLDIIKTSIDDDIEINATSNLVGGNSMLDSMGLVQTCIALEDKSQEHGFNFDWTSEKAMSTMSSVFRTPSSLVQEYNRQLKQSLK